MSGKFLLDTNIVIGLFQGEEALIERLKQIKSVFVPSIVIGELYFGAFNSGKPKENVNRVSEFSLKSAILCSDQHTAKIYGEIKTKLKSIGKPIPENDIWIAAIAKQYDLILLSRDVHFKNVSGISCEKI
ncbi:MAG: type II toxin-antitoxin system VapC family toxin [Candidatus Rifleibacteriota bacterium]